MEAVKIRIRFNSSIDFSSIDLVEKAMHRVTFIVCIFLWYDDYLRDVCVY